MTPLTNPRVRIRVAIAALMVVGVFGAVGAWMVVDALDDRRVETVDRAYEALLEVREMEAALTDRFASTRGFLLSGDPAFLEQRGAAIDAFAARLAHLRELRAAPSDLLDRIDVLRGAVDRGTAIAIDLRRDDRGTAIDAWERRVRPSQAELHAEVRSLAAIARARLDDALDATAAAARRGRSMIVALAVACLAAFGLMLALVVRAHGEMLRGALRAQERALLQILEQVPVGVYVVAGDGRPYYANRAARGMIAEAGPDAYEAGTDRPYPAARDPLRRALAGESSEVSDMELRRGGDVVPVHVRGGPVLAPGGTVAFAVAALQDARALIQHATRDPLTGLPNRAALHQTFHRDRLVAQRGRRPLSVAIIDLDRFKAINDRHGHAMGDRVLQATAATIVDALRRADFVARWGGEELVALMPDTNLDGARRAIEEALDAVRGLAFLGADGAAFEVTFSAGVTLVRRGETLDAAIARADAALYEAKAAGRNQVIGRSRGSAITAAPPIAAG